MSKTERNWHPNFLKYMEMIANHPNYKGLRIDRKSDGSLQWIAPKQSEIGLERIDWCEKQAENLGIPKQPGMYADVMLRIHPTKEKVCQICGKAMSLYYLYPNVNFLKALNKKFNSQFSCCDNINDIWDALIDKGNDEIIVGAFLIQKGELLLNPKTATKLEIIKALELACRKGGKACLGPGAMSNFPDRADGFHTYNRCCRASQDKGRSKENLKSYTKDRRAYEYWSDGNIAAANQFMGSSFFSDVSADHIGPISLGFVHDPRYIQKMTSSDNSSKRDRLLKEDIDAIIEIEAKTKIYPMSWYSKVIWEHIKANYKSNEDKISTLYRDALKQNMANFMYVLWSIIAKTEKGPCYLIRAFLEPKLRCFNYEYEFNGNGKIIQEKRRHLTERSKLEAPRLFRVAIESVMDYNDKSNRNIDHDLTSSEQHKLNVICHLINGDISVEKFKFLIEELMDSIQLRIIKNL